MSEAEVIFAMTSDWGVDLARPGGDTTAVSRCELINGEIGRIDGGVRFIESPLLRHFPARLGAHRRARTARGRKASLHAAGMAPLPVRRGRRWQKLRGRLFGRAR
ncbi:MAG TPA: hypothetical protein P5305_01480 [Rubrivivax sp.]|nr:hypothetical protein [Rubrivivax sp.]HRY86524.1 hypothetical protein [Rubrivivax sp.]